MNTLILGLPVDGRPVVRRQVQDLAAAGGWTLALPDVAALGHMRAPADRDALAAWLRAESAKAAGLIVSVDMLVYGGLVPSRFIDDKLPTLLARLELLRELKRAAPERLLYAFAATLRISNNNVAEEEKLYWRDYGALLWAWSFHQDRGHDGDAEAAVAAMDAIPQAIRADYLQTRARNFAVNRALLTLAHDGVIDRLILPQDDTAAFGFNIAERRALQQEIAALGLQKSVLIYPGADEVMHTLCAHMAARLRGDVKPLRVALSCSDPAHVKQLLALYEDRPVLDSLATQIEAIGACLVGLDEAADVVLALHTQGAAQGDWAMRRALPQPVAPAAAWVQQLRVWALDEGRAVAVVDLAYANGGDPELVEALGGADLLPVLSGYAGWNTASNSIGGLLAQLQLARGHWAESPNRLNTALRLAEDFVYQARLRQVLRDSVDEPALSAEQLADAARGVVQAATQAWLREMGLPGQVQRCDLPWDRTFEIGLELAP